MADVKIPALPTSLFSATTDYLVIDNGAATSKITVDNFFSSRADYGVWSDASGLSIGGFSAFSTKIYNYKAVGDIVFVQLHLVGTSNSTALTVAVPITADASMVGMMMAFLYGEDNSVYLTVPSNLTFTSVSTITIYKDLAYGAWTNSGEKAIRGQFWYKAS
jgi:hypothetical protein